MRRGIARVEKPLAVIGPLRAGVLHPVHGVGNLAHVGERTNVNLAPVGSAGGKRVGEVLTVGRGNVSRERRRSVGRDLVRVDEHSWRAIDRRLLEDDRLVLEPRVLAEVQLARDAGGYAHARHVDQLRQLVAKRRTQRNGREIVEGDFVLGVDPLCHVLGVLILEPTIGVGDACAEVVVRRRALLGCRIFDRRLRERSAGGAERDCEGAALECGERHTRHPRGESGNVARRRQSAIPLGRTGPHDGFQVAGSNHGEVDGREKSRQHAREPRRQLELGRFRLRPEANGAHLVAVGAQLAGDHVAVEHRADVLGLVAVRVSNDECGTAVNADEPTRCDVEPGFLPHFAHDRVRWRVVQLDRAAGQRPTAVVARLNEQEPIAVTHDSGDRRHQQSCGPTKARRSRTYGEIAM